MAGFLAPIDASPTIGTTEYSCVGETTTAVPLSNTTECIITGIFDFNAMAAADQFQVKLYEKSDVGSTQRVADTFIFTGVISPVLQRIDFGHLKEGYDITLKKLAGTDRAIPFKLLRVG